MTPPHLSPSTHPPPPLQVRHPFILGLECAFQSASKLHFVTEYVPGGMLFNHLRKQEMFSEKMVRFYAPSNTDPIPRPPPPHSRAHPSPALPPSPLLQARFYAAETLLGLEHLHEQRILYRDLKPENVLICASGHIKLCDFGLAAVGISASATHISASGRPVLVGTTEYMAPEVVRQQTCGQAVDLWALGVLLFEMMTGEAPWHHKEQTELQVSDGRRWHRNGYHRRCLRLTPAASPLCLTPPPPSLSARSARSCTRR